uniref:G-protein coupled receptors family 1 profile domain-containing protein n=1 Tax=Nomascus leucogenys TaxID=61853 RepID=A0A2I3H0M6_NOMLE
MSCAPNASHSPVFLLLGFSRASISHTLLFFLFLARIPPHWTPMWWNSLSVIDMGLSTVTLPQLLAHLVSDYPTIPAARCLAQFFFFYAFGVTDKLVIAVMALDRYVAICDPLRYALVMNHQRCACLLALSWVVSILHTMLHVGLILPLCWTGDAGGNVNLPHFFCDHRPFLQASCSDTHSNELAIFFEGGFLMLAAGRCRAVSTCGSHLTMVGFLYSTIIWVYFQPPSQNSRHQDMVASVMYTAITPLANPFVYSLRNKDVKGGLRRLLEWGKVDP